MLALSNTNFIENKITKGLNYLNWLIYIKGEKRETFPKLLREAPKT